MLVVCNFIIFKATVNIYDNLFVQCHSGMVHFNDVNDVKMIF